MIHCGTKSYILKQVFLLIGCNTLINIFTDNFINICFLYRFLQQIVLKKDIISVVLRKACGQCLVLIDLNHTMITIRDQMKNWKMQENVKRAYDDLYSAVDPDD